MQPVTKAQAKRIEHRMKKCLNCPSTQVEWEHSLIYAGRQMTEDWSIQPLCKNCHRGNNGTVQRKAKLKSMIRAIEMGLLEGIEQKYPKRNWRQTLIQYQRELKTIRQISTNMVSSMCESLLGKH